MILARIAGIGYVSGTDMQLDVMLLASDRFYDDGIGYQYNESLTFAQNMDGIKTAAAAAASSATGHTYSASDVNIL